MLSVQRKRSIVTDHSRGPSVGLSVCGSVCPVDCGKTPGRIRMPFDVVGRTGPWMRQVIGFGDRQCGANPNRDWDLNRDLSIFWSDSTV